MKLSVAVATHNEEKNISRTLESVYDWVDEIVVVDGESTDKAVEVVKKLDTTRSTSSGQIKKIKGYKESNPAMFHINKQKAIERCTGDWILQLDADEVVSPELKREIQSVINNSVIPAKDGIYTNRSQVKPGMTDDEIATPSARNDDVVAYWIPRLNYFLGKPLRKGGRYPDYTIRLYKNGVAKFPCRDVHEQVDVRRTEIPSSPAGVSRDPNEIATPSARNNNGAQIGRLKSDLLHYPYKSFTDYLTKWIRYCELEADILYKKGLNPSWANFFLYIFWYPDAWFVKTFVRNRGYVDGFPGFVFSVFSALRYRVTYTLLVERHINAKS